MKQNNKLWITSYRRRKPMGKYADDYTLKTVDGMQTLRYTGAVYQWNVRHGMRRLVCGGLGVLICLLSVTAGLISSELSAMYLVNLLYGLAQAALVLFLYYLIAVLALGETLERIDFERKARRCNDSALLFSSVMSCTLALAALEFCVGTTWQNTSLDYLFLTCTALSALLGWSEWHFVKKYSRKIVKT